MARRTRFLTAGTVLLALLMPSAALAADPATVTVRVEGDADTLLARTHRPGRAARPSSRDGNSCPGDSAAAALERATAGAWGGTWNAGFSDWELTTIKGETHSFSAAAYWGFFLNDAVASAGVCTQKVQAGRPRAVRARAVELRSASACCTLERRARRRPRRARRSRSP